MTSLDAITPLLTELNDLKRLRIAARPGSLAAHGFVQAWVGLASGLNVTYVAERTAAEALVAVRLAGIDRALLVGAGVAPGRAAEIERRALDDAARGALGPELTGRLGRALGDRDGTAGEPPSFVEALGRQPRAGATAPGRARLVLEPAESHADHCVTVAVYAVLLAPRYGAEPAGAFLAAMAHHLHNARLPDAGFAGEELLGDDLAPMVVALRNEALAVLAPGLRRQIEAALGELADATTPLARAFHAADVLDRVLQARWYAQAASYTLSQAMVDLELVHAGPVQSFHLEVLREAGLWGT